MNNANVRRVFSASDASDALRMLSTDDAEVRRRRELGYPAIDAVFADLEMPGLSGMEMSRVFAALDPAPVLVFVTGHAHEAVNAFDLGAVDYVLKPCQQERLDRAVKRVVEKLLSNPIAEAVPGAEPVKNDDEVIPVELAGTTKLIRGPPSAGSRRRATTRGCSPPRAATSSASRSPSSKSGGRRPGSSASTAPSWSRCR